MIPNFRNDAESTLYDEQHQPLRNAMGSMNGLEYELRYGERAANAADRCRITARAGDQRRFLLACKSLSLIVNPPVARTA